MPEINVPCLPGDTVYILLKHISGVYDIFETTVAVVNVCAYEDKIAAQIRVYSPYSDMSERFSYMLEDVGNKLFLTLEDAEKKLQGTKTFRTYPKCRKAGE